MSGIVIIGAGQAAGQAAASLRQAGYEGNITMFGEEEQAPYQRPPLSKAYLSGEIGIDRVLIRPEKFYADKAISLHTGTCVSRVDPAEKTISTDNGETHPYDKLLIATGSRPRILNIQGSNLDGVHNLRTVADVDAIRTSMESARKVCIVGGGYIGLEVAAVAKTKGLDVTVLEMEQRILQRVTTPEMSAFYQQLHISRGVDIRTETMVTSFGGDTKVSSVIFGDETIRAQVVIVGIGVVPNVKLAQDAGLKCDNGIIVDNHCRTSDPHIYAAGDCTNHPNPLLGRNLRLESVPNAMEQARVASANMLGDDKVYAAIPWFWSDQYNLKLQMVGFSADGDTSIIRGDKSSNQFAVFYLKKGKVVAVDAVNSPREFMVCKQLYGKSVNAEDLANPEFELKSLLK